MFEVVEQESFPYPQNEAALLHAVVGFNSLSLRTRKLGCGTMIASIKL